MAADSHPCKRIPASSPLFATLHLHAYAYTRACARVCVCVHVDRASVRAGILYRVQAHACRRVHRNVVVAVVSSD